MGDVFGMKRPVNRVGSIFGGLDGGIGYFDQEAHDSAIGFALAFTVAEFRRQNERLQGELDHANKRVSRLLDEKRKQAPPADEPGRTRATIDELAAKIAASMPAAGTWSAVSLTPPPEPTSFYPAPVVGPPPVAPSVLWTPEKAAEVAAMTAMARTATPHPLSAPVAGPPGYEPAIPWPSASYALHPPPPIPAVPATDEEIAARFNLAPHQVQAVIERGMPVVGPIVSAGPGEGAEGGPPAPGEENYQESLPERTADDARYQPIEGDMKQYPGGAQWTIREFVADGDLWITCASSGGAIRVSRRQWSNSAPNAFCGTVGTVWTPAHLVVVAELESDPVEPPSVSPASAPAGPSGFMPSIASSFAYDDYYHSRGDAKTPPIEDELE